MPNREPIAWRHIAGSAALLLALLLLGSGGYGYHRDELYFRMLAPAWGYVDQPPLTPLLAEAVIAAFGDHLWAIRVPAALAAVAALVLVVLLCRVLGGDHRAQAIAAWGFALCPASVMFGHVLLTAITDLALWCATALAVLVAVRRKPVAWLVAGALAGIATSNRWLVAVLVAGLVVGLAACGPWRVFRSPMPWLGALVGLAVAAPNLAYQATNGWPQFAMGSALAEENADAVRVEMWPLMLVLLGPPLVAVWIAGLLRCLRTPDLRFVAVAFVVVIGFTFVAGAQPHYTVGALAIAFAAGCVPVAAWLRTGARWGIAIPLWVLNAITAIIIGLPVLPLGSLAATPLPAMSSLLAEQVGWPRYVAQVGEAYRAAQRDASGPVAVIASNYGEAGAIDRFGAEHGLPSPVSGHNQLWHEGRPVDGTRTVVIVGGQAERVSSLFASCEVVDRLDNGVGVENEEQGMPIAVCRDPVAPWSELWPRFRHLD